MSKKRKRRDSTKHSISMTAHEALELAETMSDGEYAQMAIAAELLGIEYDEFIDRLIGEIEHD